MPVSLADSIEWASALTLPSPITQWGATFDCTLFPHGGTVLMIIESFINGQMQEDARCTFTEADAVGRSTLFLNVQESGLPRNTQFRTRLLLNGTPFATSVQLKAFA